MRLFVLAFIAAFMLASCGGGGAINPGPDPTPQPDVPNLNGLWHATYSFSLAQAVIATWSDPLVMVQVGQDEFDTIDGAGEDTGNIRASNGNFTWTGTDEEAVGTGVYRLTVNITGAATASSLTGQGQATFTLISGIDSEGMDGLVLSVSVNAQRQGQTPTGTAVDISGTWLMELEVINPPDGLEDNVFSGNLTITRRSGQVYNAVDEEGETMTVVVAGSTWYAVSEEDSEDLPGYIIELLMSGPVTATSMTGGGNYTVSTEPGGSDYLLLDGLQLQLIFQAAKLN